MNEKSNIQRDAIDEVEMVPLVHFSDVETGTESLWSRPSTGRSRFISVMCRRTLFIFRDVFSATHQSLKPGETKIRKGSLMVHVFGFTTSRNDPLRETAWLDGLRGVAAFLVMVYRELNFFLLDSLLISQTTTWICLPSPPKHLTVHLAPKYGNFGDYLISESSGVPATLKSASSSCYQDSSYPGQVYPRSEKDSMRDSHSL